MEHRELTTEEEVDLDRSFGAFSSMMSEIREKLSNHQQGFMFCVMISADLLTELDEDVQKVWLDEFRPAVLKLLRRLPPPVEAH